MYHRPIIIGQWKNLLPQAQKFVKTPKVILEYGQRTNVNELKPQRNYIQTFGMELLDDPEIKKKYEKCKYIVKVWEHQFFKKHKRVPSKLDIREASREVRNAYKRYFQLKTAALEQSFMDVEGFEDEDENIDTNCSSSRLNECENVLASTENKDHVQSHNSSPDDPCKNDTLRTCDITMASQESIQVPVGVWGAHLNHKKEEAPSPVEDKKQNANLSITRKLFCGSKFTKRNPRKSLSFSQRNKSDTVSDGQFSFSQPPPTTFASFTSEEAIFASQNESSNNSFKIVAHSEKVQSQSVNIIQSFLENNSHKPLKTIDTGWLERVFKTTGTSFVNPDLVLPQSDEILNHNEYMEIEATKLDYDSEDIIEESDEETPYKDSTLLHIAKKKKVDITTKPNEIVAEAEVEMQTSCEENNIEKMDIEIEPELKKCNEITKPTDVDISNSGNKIESKAGSIPICETNTITSPLSETKLQVNLQRCDEKEIKAQNGLKKSTPKKSKRTPRKKASSKKQPKKLPPKKKENGHDVLEISPRRSSRRTKVKVSLQEFPSDDDPFHTDTDEKDPEFNLNEESSKFHSEDTLQQEDKVKKKTPKTARTPRGTKIPKGTKERKRKKIEEDNEEEDKDESKPYELEFSIKPRIVAPRYSNLSKIVSKTRVASKGDKKTNENKKTKEEKIISDMSAVKDKNQQAKAILEKKIATGKLNDNFVRIDIKKKVFVRGKSGKSFSKFKKAQWRSNKAKSLAGPDMDMGGCDGGMLTCFNCGQIGHFARNCKATKGDGLLPLSRKAEEECPFPSLEEASQMAKSSNLTVRIPSIRIKETLDSNDENRNNDESSQSKKSDDEIASERESEQTDDNHDPFDDDLDSEELLLETLRLEEHVRKLDVQMYMDNVKVVEPYFRLKEDNSIIDTPPEVYACLEKFGHSSFRPGQEQAVMRILSGKSTLVTLSTGSGKSLCYQLPAYLYSQREPCISLIISPLVSLMDDQITSIAKFIKAACLHSNQTKQQRQKILEAISLGDLSVLLVSPEAVVAGEKKTGFGSFLRKLPPIAFACIDEAHCVSQWSHNFRPSYLMICKVLRESLGIKTILGLTATATRATRDSIIEHLQIPDGEEGVITDTPLPDNLILTVSKDATRDHALLGLLMSERFVSCKSVIVYCTRRQECERIATFLRTSLKSEKPVANDTKKRKRVNLAAEPYHAGLPASRRRAIQNAFMSGELRIVVATVAFGMGINKSDIRAVIHYNMPSSFESYVQEVGRAGRDGLEAHCHVFLDSRGNDENELRRHIYSNSLDRHVIRKLLQKVFIPCSCTGVCPKHEVAFSIKECEQLLDVPEENISTLLCYLQLHNNKYIELASAAYTKCKIISYGGPMQIRKAAKDCPPLAMALALHKQEDGEDQNVLEFPVVDVAAAIGWESGICKHKLKNLEWITVNNQQRRSNISVQFSDLGFRLFAPGNLSEDHLDEALDNLYNRVVNQEQTALLQLNAIHETLREVAKPSFSSCLSTDGDSLIKTKVREYFNSPNPLKLVAPAEPVEFNEEQLVADIRALINMYRDNSFSGRAIARIFQGIQSPNYPAVIWYKCKFWRGHVNKDFHSIVKIATREIIRMR